MSASTHLQYGGLPAGLQAGHGLQATRVIMRDQSSTTSERNPHELTARHLPTPEGPGSVSGAPNLPDGFTGTFTSRYVDTGDLRQHVVTGGDGPPLLLVHGWPQTWYAWRLVMPALARDFQVVAPDQRGMRAVRQTRRTGTTPAPWPATWSR